MNNMNDSENSLKGKFYELLNIDNSVMQRFEIKHVKETVMPSITHTDGSFSPQRTRIEVSENGTAWFRIYGGSSDRIKNK